MKRAKAIVSMMVVLFLLSLPYMMCNVSAEGEAVVVVDHPGPTPAPPTVNPGTELKYDDGTAEWGISATDYGISEEMKLGVRFTPPSPSLVTELIFYIYSGSMEPLMVHVLDSSMADIITPFAITPVTDWNVVDLSSHCIVVKGDFFIALQHTVSDTSWVGLDTDAPDGRSWWYGTSGGWQLWPEGSMPDGDFLIRAVVEEVPPHLIPEYPLGTIMGLIACFAAFAAFVKSKRSGLPFIHN